MRRMRVPWYLFTALLLGLSATLGGVPVAAQNTTGASLRAADADVIIKNGTVHLRNAKIEAGGAEDFVGNGFGPGEVVSISVTFPDGRVFPVVHIEGGDCCVQSDEALADGTGSIYFELAFDLTQNYPSTTGSATDGTQFTNSIFVLPPESVSAVPPYGT